MIRAGNAMIDLPHGHNVSPEQSVRFASVGSIGVHYSGKEGERETAVTESIQSAFGKE